LKERPGNGSETLGTGVQSHPGRLLRGLAREAVGLVRAFAIGAPAGAGVRLRSGLPLALSLFGGALVPGVAPARA